MKRFIWIALVLIFVALVLSCSAPPVEEQTQTSVKDKLAEWRKGVWLLGDGSYAIYTDTHYFVVMVSGDSASPNIYCGASQVKFHDLEIDTTQFAPNTCNIVDGIIYDSVTEVTDEYILLATCNGDREKIFSNGTAAYLPAGGGEFYSVRIESF